MKIRERIEFYLAKLAGKEVDMDSIKPNQPASTVEELLEEIAERLDAISEAVENINPDDIEEKLRTLEMGVQQIGDRVAKNLGSSATMGDLVEALKDAGLMKQDTLES